MEAGDNHDEENKSDLPSIPVFNILKTMKLAVPANYKIASDAKLCMQECAFEFLAFITSEAAEKCRHERRKTLSGEDILMAFSSLGLDYYLDPLRLYLAKLREIRLAKKAYGGEHENGDHTITNIMATYHNRGEAHNDGGAPEPHSQQNLTQPLSFTSIPRFNPQFEGSTLSQEAEAERQQRTIESLQSFLSSIIERGAEGTTIGPLQPLNPPQQSSNENQNSNM